MNSNLIFILLLSMVTAISVLLLIHERRQRRAASELFRRFTRVQRRGDHSDETVDRPEP